MIPSMPFHLHRHLCKAPVSCFIFPHEYKGDPLLKTLASAATSSDCSVSLLTSLTPSHVWHCKYCYYCVAVLILRMQKTKLPFIAMNTPSLRFISNMQSFQQYLKRYFCLMTLQILQLLCLTMLQIVRWDFHSMRAYHDTTTLQSS